MIDEALRQLVAEAVTAAVAPLVAEVRELRMAVAAGASRWVTRAEAAEILSCSIDTIDRLAERKELQVRRAGRSVRVLIAPPATNEEIARLASEGSAL